MAGLDISRWDLLLRQAQAASLLPRLAVLAQSLGLLDAMPRRVLPHLVAALSVAHKQRQAVRWEVRRIAQALAGVDVPIVLLKGAAYAIADLPPAAGRLFSDVDILVPREALPRVEAALMLAGWHPNRSAPYDDRYYREWMHELPPLKHVRRGTVVDVHHNLLPETSRLKTRPEPILDAARPLPGVPGLSLPTTEDLVVHSACHRFHEGEWQHGLRDLVDVDAMLRASFGSQRAWDALLARAEDLNLGRPLCYALMSCRRWLRTPIPQGVLDSCPGQPAWWQRRAMQALIDAAVGSFHHSCRWGLTGPASLMLYIRGHYLRMPWRLLIPHLVHKALPSEDRGA